MKPVLVRDLALERWASMDRYAEALASRIAGAVVPEDWRMEGPRWLTRYWRYPARLRRWRGDLVHILDHSYAHCLRSFPGLPSVVTVHDLLPLRTIAEAPLGVRGRVRNRLLHWVLDWVERADRVIVSTSFTGREVTRYLGVDEARVCVVPYGVESHFFDAPPAAAIVARRAAWNAALGRGGPAPHVVLHVGSCHPRKNVEAAIAATGFLRHQGLDAVLVQVGGEFRPAHHQAIRAGGLERAVLQEPAVAEPALVAAYYAADVLVLPSTFEGWGLPAIEAMAAGLPVVTSGAGGLREAVGDAAVVTGAVGADAIAAALARVLTDPACRAEFVARGRVRARALDWDHCAAHTRAVYDGLRGS